MPPLPTALQYFEVRHGLQRRRALVTLCVLILFRVRRHGQLAGQALQQAGHVYERVLGHQDLRGGGMRCAYLSCMWRRQVLAPCTDLGSLVRNTAAMRAGDRLMRTHMQFAADRNPPAVLSPVQGCRAAGASPSCACPAARACGCRPARPEGEARVRRWTWRRLRQTTNKVARRVMSK